MEALQLATDVIGIDDDRSPLQVFRSMRDIHEGESFLLESVEGTEKTARYSFLGFDPILVFKSTGSTCEITTDEGMEIHQGNPVETLRKILGNYRVGSVGITPFSGGMVGYLSYDFVRHFENLPSENPDPLGLPESYLVMPRYVICYDHLKNQKLLICHGGDPPAGLSGRNEIHGDGHAIGECKPWMDRDRYEAMVRRAKDYIVEGDIFQTVLSLRYDARLEGDTLSLYETLRTINPSPYQYFLDFEDTKIIGASPEMLVRLENGRLVTRPLAGTRPRGENAEEDEKLRVEMLLDEKERAEHLMLVDLARNDLGRVSDYGSVQVSELMGTEKYSHVQHIVSHVISGLKPGYDALDTLRAVFPAGTVSGAPKVRAMEIIEELEPLRRGPYGGAVGYIDFQGNMDLAIAIRTMFTSKGKLHLQAGSGIVHDSDPEIEYQECQNKLRALYQAVGGEAL